MFPFIIRVTKQLLCIWILDVDFALVCMVISLAVDLAKVIFLFGFIFINNICQEI